MYILSCFRPLPSSSVWELFWPLETRFGRIASAQSSRCFCHGSRFRAALFSLGFSPFGPTSSSSAQLCQSHSTSGKQKKKLIYLPAVVDLCRVMKHSLPSARSSSGSATASSLSGTRRCTMVRRTPQPKLEPPPWTRSLDRWSSSSPTRPAPWRRTSWCSASVPLTDRRTVRLPPPTYLNKQTGRHLDVKYIWSRVFEKYVRHFLYIHSHEKWRRICSLRKICKTWHILNVPYIEVLFFSLLGDVYDELDQRVEITEVDRI